MPRQLHLNLNILNAGFVGSAWRHPDSDPLAAFDVDHYVRAARIAERGFFDAIFLADTPALKDSPEWRPWQALEPTVILATIAAQTRNIGLIATVSTSFNEPYNIARRFATLDMASRGRIGINLVTTADDEAARNFGLARNHSHGERYARAGEFAGVLKQLWDSWEDDALRADKASAEYLDTGRVHPIAHRGTFFSVDGPLNLPRPPQGHPVIVQAGGSQDGRDLAAAHAELVFLVAQTPKQGRTFAADLRARAARLKRRPDSLRFLPGLATVIGSTEAEARARHEALLDLLPLPYSLARLAHFLGTTPEALDPDRPLPDLPRPADGNHSMFEATMALARIEGLTVRQLARRLAGGSGHPLAVGTPEQIADRIADWFLSGAADGFNLMPDLLPSGAEIFVDEVVPILQKRGLFRRSPPEGTLRDRFGLARPPGRQAARTQGDAA